MHVIVLENQPSSLRGGQELSLLDVCKGLAGRGHSISLVYLQAGDLLEQYQSFCDRVIQVNSFILERKKTNSIFSFITDTWKIPASKNSVVYSNRYQDIVFGYASACLKQIPLVCHLRLPPPENFSLNGFSPTHGISLRGVKRYIATSKQTKLDWVKVGVKEKKIDVVYNAINTDIFSPSEILGARKEWFLSEESKVISYVGRLDREKGVETLLKAFALVLKSNINAKLLIAGKPLSTQQEYKNFLEQLSVDLGIQKSVTFLGQIANTASLYQASDVTVLPSLWSEPFGRTTIEAMACGTPVVGSRTGGIPEVLTGEFQAGLFEPGNESDLAVKLNRLLDWRQQDPQLAKRCRNHVLSHFSLNTMVEGVERVLMQVMK